MSVRSFLLHNNVGTFGEYSAEYMQIVFVVGVSQILSNFFSPNLAKSIRINKSFPYSVASFKGKHIKSRLELYYFKRRRRKLKNIRSFFFRRRREKKKKAPATFLFRFYRLKSFENLKRIENLHSCRNFHADFFCRRKDGPQGQ